MLAATPLGISFVLYEAILVVMLACKGLCFTSSVALAMNEKHNNAGAASALVGAIIFIFGGIVSPLVGMGDIILYTSITFVACASCSLSPAICGAPLIFHIIFWHCGFFLCKFAPDKPLLGSTPKQAWQPYPSGMYGIYLTK